MPRQSLLTPWPMGAYNRGMDSYSSNELRHGLAQILRTYASAGVKRFQRTTDVQIPAELLQVSASQTAATTLKSHADATHAQTTATQQSLADKTTSSRPITAIQSESAATETSSQQTSSQRTSLQATSAPISSRVQGVTPGNTSPTPSMRDTAPGAARATASSAAPLLQIAPGPWPLPSLPMADRQSMLSELNQQVVACRKCEELVCYRRQTVFGEGNLQPRICFYGEAPGADEDAQGRPFVGAAGKLLSDIIRAMRLTREEVYILNSLKCRPPQNRTPLPDEVENCRAYGLTQLAILQPEFIILLGAVAARSVLQTTESVGRLRGRFHSYQSARVLVTYHPAYLLRNADAKKLVWADVQMVMREIGTLPKPN